MVKRHKLSNTETVSLYIQQLEEPTRSIVESLRQLILNIDTGIAEEIKWNAPSFYYSGEMKPLIRKNTNGTLS